MAFILKDRVKETSTTTGTGNISLGGAAATFDSFQSYLTNGDTTFYAIAHTSSGVDEWEVGLGTWNTGNTLSRTTVLAGSNGTSAVNFSAGSKDIFMTYPASKVAVAGEDVTFADITVTGTVDGRDVAADGSKLDGIDTSADVTDAVTVAAAGALMRSGGTMTGNLILNADPNAALGAATKQYVDTIASAGIHYHAPVRAEHPSNLNATYNNGSSGVGATLTNAGTNAALVIDSVNMVLNDRVLVANQTDQTQNGVYTVTTVGDGSTAWVLTRSTDTDTAAPSDPDAFGKGDAFFIKEGSTNAGHLDVLSTAGTIVFGTTNIVFSEVAETTVYSGGTGITLTGITFSIGQDVATSSNVTFNQVTAAIIGNVTGNLTGDVTGNADTATTLETARTIQLSGDVTGSASFDGSSNINITAAVQDDSHAHVISNVDGLQSALDAKVPTSRIITAGNGLTGGGDLSANRTLNVGGGTGVTVSADAVSIGQAVGTTDNVTFNAIRADGGNLILGDEALSSSTVYVGMKTSWMSGSNDYMIISGTSDGNTYISAKDGSNVHIRGGANTSNYEIKVFPNAYATAAGSTIITEAGGGLSKSSRTLSHSDTSSQGSVDNSGGTVIQDVTLDTYGHVTGLASYNLDGRYYTETEADSRFVNASGDSMTGTLTIDNGNMIRFDRSGGDAHQRADARLDGSDQARLHWYGKSDSQVTRNFKHAWYDGANYINVTASGSGRIDFTGSASTMYIGSDRVFDDGYHPNADKWTTARTLSLSGDASGSVSWDGSANATLSVAVADDSHNHTISNIDNLSVGGLTGMRLTTTSGYIEFGPANTTWAHIYTDRPNFYFNKDLYVNNQRVYHTGYHPNADTLTTARTINGVSFNGSANITVADSTKLPLSGGTMTGDLTINEDGDSINLRSTTNAAFVGISFSSQNPTPSQFGHIRFNHSDAASYGSGALLELGSTESTTTILADGKLMYDEGIYAKPASGTGAGTRKDANWDTAYTTANAALPKAGGTMTGELQLNARLDVGDGSGGDTEIRIYKADNNISDHIQFYNGTTRVGEIGCHDTTWLRINQSTAKNIYTPRYMRADGGFFVDGTTKGINGSGNFIGGTITGASDANVSNWNTAYGWGDHAAAGYTSNVGDITGVTAGTNLNGGGTSGSVTLNLDSTIDLTEVHLGSEVQLRESTDRADLLQITSSTSTWAGLQIRNSSNEGRWSFMTDGSTAGFYDDENNEWAVQMQENGSVTLYHNNGGKINTTSTGVNINNDINDVSNIYLRDRIYHSQDTHTYIGFDGFGDEFNVNAGGTNVLNANLGGVEVHDKVRGINHINSYLQWHASNQMRMVVGGVERLEVKATSPHVLVSGDLNSTSDERLKKNIKPIDNALADICQLEGVTFDWRDTGTQGQGFIAQQVEPIIPEVVNTDEDTGMKSINYVGLIGHLVEAIKEQQGQIDDLKAEIQSIKS